jgi:hypothetical protein
LIFIDVYKTCLFIVVNEKIIFPEVSRASRLTLMWW